MFTPNELLWALIGLLLTIGGTFLEAFIASPPWSWGAEGVLTYSLGVTYQIGAVLLIGCLGGKNAAALSQIAYLALGLAWFPVFSRGGGLGYVREPTFGYLIGFVVGAWICGWLAFQAAPRLELLGFSCLCGLLGIHLTGFSYLLITYLTGWLEMPSSLWEAIWRYSLQPIPGHLAIACAAAVLAYGLRRLMFY